MNKNSKYFVQYFCRNRNAFSQNMCEYDEEVLRSHEKEIIDRIAVVNVKKSNGENSSNYEDLEKYAMCYCADRTSE